MKATTPYRRLQERVQELEEISKVHQKQNGELQVKLNEKDKKIQELTDRLEATTEGDIRTYESRKRRLG
jgi:predicted nuclease with TOPRIM domain